jgi:hypothetical protein
MTLSRFSGLDFHRDRARQYLGERHDIVGSGLQKDTDRALRSTQSVGGFIQRLRAQLLIQQGRGLQDGPEVEVRPGFETLGCAYSGGQL